MCIRDSFNIQLLKGTVNFLKENDPEIAITEEFARKLFGNEEDALGKEVELNGRSRKIGAIVSGWSRHSNIPYSVLVSARHYPRWGSKGAVSYTHLDVYKRQGLYGGYAR